MKTTKFFRILFVLCLSALFTGCVHEFPDDNPVDPTLIEVDVTLSIDMEFETETILQTYSDELDGDYDIRYIIDIYEAAQAPATRVTNRIVRIVQTENTIITRGLYHVRDTLRLPAKQYQIIAWIDFVDKGTETDKYYDTDDLQSISILLRDGQYRGYSTTRDAFTAKCEMDLTPFRGQRYVHYTAEVEAKRPFAIYRIITTDIEEYRTYHQSSYAFSMPSWTRVAYNLFFPMGYNSFLYAPERYTPGIGYSYNFMDVVPEKEAEIASDYVFVEDDTFYLVDFSIMNLEGMHVNTVNNLRINLKRNHITIISNEFLTKDINNNGGIGISDGFSDEIVIRI